MATTAWSLIPISVCAGVGVEPTGITHSRRISAHADTRSARVASSLMYRQRTPLMEVGRAATRGPAASRDTSGSVAYNPRVDHVGGEGGADTCVAALDCQLSAGFCEEDDEGRLDLDFRFPRRPRVTVDGRPSA